MKSKFAKPLNAMSSAELAEYNNWKAGIDSKIVASKKSADDAAMILAIVVFPALLMAFMLLTWN